MIFHIPSTSSSRALYLMTKRNFKSPGLTHKNKWSENFHDFLRNALMKDPKRRPTAAELLKVRCHNGTGCCWSVLYTDTCVYIHVYNFKYVYV